MDPVEEALASALSAAAGAGRWEVVATLAKELESRRALRDDPKVVDLAAERAKRK